MTVSVSPSGSDRVVIFDTTLRDGEQSPGASMNLEEKLRVAEALEAMGVDVIEAGFPVASPGDFEAVKAIAERSTGSVICGLSRAVKADIARCAEAIRPAKRQRIHTFISTSPLHMKYKLQLEPDVVLARVGESVAFARTLVEDVEWSAEDGSRTEPDFLCRCVEAAIAAGASTINIPDTVGYAIPEEYAALIKGVMDRVPNADKAIFSVHCHNDLGLAVANSLAAVRAGARQIECTVNGLGERAGNAAMEEVVMAIKTRHDTMPFTTGINDRAHHQDLGVLGRRSPVPIQRTRRWWGRTLRPRIRIHQDGMLKTPNL
jgi:2-isopropylmalate synthase